MQKRTYLDPAHSLIRSFAQDGNIGKGIDAVAKIVGRHRTNVYRWMLPEERKGTGGFIPADSQRKLLEYAQKNRNHEGLRDFFGARAA